MSGVVKILWAMKYYKDVTRGNINCATELENCSLLFYLCKSLE